MRLTTVIRSALATTMLVLTIAACGGAAEKGRSDAIRGWQDVPSPGTYGHVSRPGPYLGSVSGLSKAATSVVKVRVLSSREQRGDEVNGADVPFVWRISTVRVLENIAGEAMPAEIEIRDSVHDRGANPPPPAIEQNREYVVFLVPFRWSQRGPQVDSQWMRVDSDGQWEVREGRARRQDPESPLSAEMDEAELKRQARR